MSRTFHCSSRGRWESNRSGSEHEEVGDMRLEGKTALVTGGGTGIGRAITERFVAEGAKVCITGRRKAKLDEVCSACPAGFVLSVAGDIASYDDARMMVKRTIEFGGGIDILVNNAATDCQRPVTELRPEDWRRVIDTNLSGAFYLMREAIPHMVAVRGGSVINVASIGGLRCMPAAPAYGVSKAGLIFLAQQAALDYGPYGVRCNAVCPGATRTEMLEEALSGIGAGAGVDVDAILARFAAGIPLRRVSSPHEIAAVCAFLAGDESSFMTGAVLVVDGGESIVDVGGAAISLGASMREVAR
jgi:meso-butanediol dehydrogenase/(S,S)-butanediol dehydrogenase/diacetyl reductase